MMDIFAHLKISWWAEFFKGPIHGFSDHRYSHLPNQDGCPNTWNENCTFKHNAIKLLPSQLGLSASVQISSITKGISMTHLFKEMWCL